jgi:hypothetical protein
MKKQKQLYWEDVKEGDEIPPLHKIATTQVLVKWACATGEFGPLHYDYVWAKSKGFEGPIVHGQLKKAWLVQLIIDWIGEEGFLKKFSCSFRGVDYPRVMKSITEPEEGEILLCKGRVARKKIEDDEPDHDQLHLVECEIWVENEKGEKTTTGNATVVLPSPPK